MYATLQVLDWQCKANHKVTDAMPEELEMQTIKAFASLEIMLFVTKKSKK